MNQTQTKTNNRQQQREDGGEFERLIQRDTTNWAEMPRELAILKMENDNIVSLAQDRPRNHREILQRLLDQVDAYPTFARVAIYCKPIGKGPEKCLERKCGHEWYFKGQEKNLKCPACKSANVRKGTMQFARNLSIRAAEAIAEAVGFNRIASDVEKIDDNTVKVTCSYTDYQSGRVYADASLCSRFYKSRWGGGGSHSDDRFFGMVVKGEKSRVLREVITRCTPPGLRAELFEAIEAKLEALLTPEHIERIVAEFAAKGVSGEELEFLVGKPYAKWEHKERDICAGIWNSIKDDESSIDELLEEYRTENAPAQAVPVADTGDVSAGDILGGPTETTPPEGQGRTAKPDEAKPAETKTAKAPEAEEVDTVDELEKSIAQAREKAAAKTEPKPAGETPLFEGGDDGEPLSPEAEALYDKIQKYKQAKRLTDLGTKVLENPAQFKVSQREALLAIEWIEAQQAKLASSD